MHLPAGFMCVARLLSGLHGDGMLYPTCLVAGLVKRISRPSLTDVKLSSFPRQNGPGAHFLSSLHTHQKTHSGETHSITLTHWTVVRTSLSSGQHQYPHLSVLHRKACRFERRSQGTKKERRLIQISYTFNPREPISWAGSTAENTH